MKNDKSTSGRLEVQMGDALVAIDHVDDENRGSSYAYIAQVYSLGDVWGVSDAEANANARRLAACWNAMEDMPIETIEHLAALRQAQLIDIRKRGRK